MDFSFDWIGDPTAWLGLATLIALEIVLGIDNLIFIAIVADKLPGKQRDRARIIGLSLAMFMRLALLASISWLTSLTQPLFTVLGFELSGRDMILMAGGAFLLFKATTELHERLEGARRHSSGPSMQAGFWATVVQIIVLDAVFSIDSVITAVGMSNELVVMMTAVVIAVIVMMLASGPLMRFVSAHPTVIVLCLGFLLMIGFSLVLDGFHVHVPKGYLYAAIGFSVLIEALNQLGQRNRRKAVLARDLRARTADAVLRLLGAGRTGEPVVEDDVAALAATIGRAAVFTPVEKEMVRSVFDLVERPVRSLMTPRREVIWLDINAPPEQVRQRVLQTNRSRYPLARRTLDNLVGVARAQQVLRDVLEKRELGAKTCEGQPLVVHDRMNALQLLERFRRERNHFAVVVDEFGSVQGVVTPADVLQIIAGVPPEAGDGPLAGEKQPDGAWVFDGAVALRQVCESLAASLPESGAYATIAGFLLTEFGSLPQPGDTLERLGLHFEIVSIEGQRIAKIKVQKAPPAAARADAQAAS